MLNPGEIVLSKGFIGSAKKAPLDPTKKDSKTKCYDCMVIVNTKNACVSSIIVLMHLLILRFSTCFVEFSQNLSILLTDQLPRRADMASASVGEQRPGSLRSVSELPPISLCFRDLIPYLECPPHLSPENWGRSIIITLKTTDLGKLKALVIVGAQEDIPLSVCQQLSWDHTVEVRQFIDWPLIL